ncbi:vacuolar fusion protein MON1 homolog A-like [Rhopilema esculentum]|uniref:vacuolar fusion protein MON1 homolog A-like n=1 Tax=Rhopilema esculentum TaxID=499914 RepID=UPI0031D16310
MAEEAAKREIDVSEEVEDVEQGEEPGAGKLDTTLFAAESFEDLSNDISLKNIDEEFLVRRKSTSDSYDNDVSANEPEEREDVFELPVSSSPTKDHRTGSTEVDIDEVRKQRAETVLEAERDSTSEDASEPGWVLHKKHVFILSEAGKPIYTRYGNEEKLVTMMGVMQAIVSFVQDNDDNIRVICAGKHKFVFVVRGPLILVAVCYGNDSPSQLLVQLNYVYHQILSVLTHSQLCRVFEQRRNYDLRKLLAGTEKFIDNLMNLMSTDPSFLLGAVRCLSLPGSVRDIIGQTLQQARAKDLIFAIVVAHNQLVTMVRPKKFILHPSDLHLIFNLVSASTAFRTAESWTPICLPKFDNTGYLHAYVSYFDDNCPACLLLLSIDRNSFFELSECKEKIKERLERHKCLEAITKANRKKSYTIDQTGIPDLWHFMYKSRSTAQFTSPEIGAPYVTTEERERLFEEYLYLHKRIHSSLRPLKMLCHVGHKEMLIGWVTSGFELYTAFSPLSSKVTAMNAVNKLLRWIKKEEDRLFIINSYTF